MISALARDLSLSTLSVGTNLDARGAAIFTGALP